MDRCRDFQEQMLDFVYELLDAAGADDLRAHVDVCPECQGALREAQQQQQVLAAAARLEFPAVRFTAPRPEPEVAVVPFTPRPTHRRIAWAGWAAAAAVLAVLSVPAAIGWDYLNTRRDLEVHQNRLAILDRDADELRARSESLSREKDKKESESLDTVRKDFRKLVVSTDRTWVAGKENECQVHLLDGNDKPVKGKLKEVRIFDKARDVVLFEAKDLEIDGTVKVRVPPKLDADPGPNSKLTLQVAAANNEGIGNDLHLEDSFHLTPPTYVAHLTTDKPLYQPGDTVRFRSLTLERFSLKPADEPMALHYTLTTPKGQAIELPPGSFAALGDGRIQGAAAFNPTHPHFRGIAGGAWDIPLEDEQFPAGEYLLTVQELGNRFPAQQRKFVVNHYQKPRLLKELTFNKRTYGLGDEVQAALKVANANGPVAGAKIDVQVSVDGKTYDERGQESRHPFRLDAVTDGEGKAIARFRLPEQMTRGQASVNVAFIDGAGPEPLLKPIPIVLKKLDVDFYPEGGHFIERVPNRVYFQVRTPQGKPAELKGRLMDSTGEDVAFLETLSDDKEPGVNQGMGVFTFTPRPNRSYHLEIDRPLGMTQKIPLDTTQNGVVGLSIPQAVTTGHEPIDIHLRSKDKARQLFVGAYCRGRLIDHARLIAPSNQDVSIALKPDYNTGGVYRITVFEEEATGGSRPLLIPRAERLIYRQPRERLNLEVALAQKKDTTVVATEKYAEQAKSILPGGGVGLEFKSRGENQEPTQAVLYVVVRDQSVDKLADEKTARSMPTQILLASEVRRPEDLEFADFLLTNHAKAKPALDLLLGTQGWRRFVEQRAGEVQERLWGEAAAQAAIANHVEVPRVARANREDADARSLELQLRDARVAIANEFAPRWQQVEETASALEMKQSEIKNDSAYVAVSAKMDRYQNLIVVVRNLLPIAGIFLLIAAGVLVACGLHAPRGRSAPYLLASAGCAALLVLTTVYAFRNDPRRDFDLDVFALGKQENGDPLVRKKAAPPGALEEDRKHSKEAEEQVVFDDKGKAKSEDVPAPPAPAQPTFGRPKTSVPPLEMPQPDNKPARGIGDGKGGEGKFASGGAGGFLGKPTEPGGPRASGLAPVFRQRGKENLDADHLTGLPNQFSRLDEAERRKLLMQVDDTAKDGKDKNYGYQAFFMDRQNRFKESSKGAADPKKRAGSKNQDAQAREGKSDKWEAKELAGDPASYFLREYAHRRDPARDQSVRDDFTDTVYWHPALLLPDGRAEVFFDLSDSVTTYQVTVWGHTADGRLAAAKPFTFDARLPLTVTTTTPTELTRSDRPLLPVTVTNWTDLEKNVTLFFRKLDENLQRETEKKEPQSKDENGLAVLGRSAARRLYEYAPDATSSWAHIEVEGVAKPHSDRLRRDIRIVPEGFPVEGARSDYLEGGRAVQDFDLPDSWINGTLQLRFSAFPSTLADLQKGLDGLLREPYGCFEQTSTSSYPNALILSYLKETDQARPEVERKARELLERGYAKLRSFECDNPDSRKREGYEWFGGNVAPHESLTAYGLLQFRDMAKHQEVDPAMLERTRKYLLSRRDGKGGFLKNEKSLDSFGRAPDVVNNAYIVWALTESGKDDVRIELNALAIQAKASKDPYFLALVAGSLINRDRKDEAKTLLDKTVQLQAKDGSLTGAATSITGSGGKDLVVESTALALLGWLKADAVRYAEPIDKSARWLGQQRGPGGAFGSTQATILTLKALLAHAREIKRHCEDGTLSLFVNDQPAGKVQITTTSSEALVLNVADADRLVRSGKNRVRIEVTGKNQFPYSLAWSCQTLKPASDMASTVKLQTKLDRAAAREGDSVRLTVRVENTEAKGQGMAVAVVGLPGGLSLPEDFKQLIAHKETATEGERPLVSMFEVRGRELILYWRDLAPKQVIEVPVDLSCRVPGTYSGPASRAYLYYNSERKTWADPLRISIAPRE